jgi:archaemetzincin
VVRLDLLPFGRVDGGALDAIEACAAGRMGMEVRRMPALPAPAFAWDHERAQFDAFAILRRALESRSPGADRVLGVTEADLFIPMLTFVFGQAQLSGEAAVISLARLRQEFYALPPAPGLLAERAAKEALHELGHTFGLVHCADRTCAASSSTYVQHIDAKRSALCRGCLALLGRDAARQPVGSEERR